MIALTRRTSLLTACVMLAALAALALTVGAPNAAAASYRTCSLSERDQDPRGDIPTYNLSLKQQRTSCATAKRVMRAFHRCRSKKRPTCTKKLVSHWRCTGRKSSSTATIFYASFTCKWGARRVKSSYQQNT